MDKIEFLLSGLFDWVVMTSLMASVLVALILLVRLVLKDKLKMRWQYIIWFVLMVRLVLPAAPESSFSMFNLFPFMNHQDTAANVSGHSAISPNDLTVSDPASAEGTNPTAAAGPSHNGSDPSVTSASDVKDRIPFHSVFVAIWLIGVTALAIYLAAANRKLARKTAACSTIATDSILDTFEQCKQDLRIRRHIPLKASNSMEGPTLYRFIRPVILLPAKGLEKFSLSEMRFIFLHELVHYKRKDVFVNWLITLFLIMHWFNPVLWYAYKKMREDQELSCDEAAISHLRPDEVKEYGYTIIKLLENDKMSSRVPAVAHFSADKSQLKRRIQMITFFKKNSYRWSVLGLAVIIVLGGCALTNSKSKDVNTQQSATSESSPKDSGNTGTLPAAAQDNVKNESSPTPKATPTPTQLTSISSAESKTIVYTNTQYGFQFSLPEGWKNYLIVSSKWEGLAIDEKSASEKVAETGPIISIRDPLWTAQTPRQDIPIMVFTLSQWNSLQQGAFHIGAAPVGPSELGRNGNYVFALPARYNFAFPPGYEEVEKILSGKPLKALEAK